MLQVHGCSDRLARGIELGQGFVASDLDQRSAAHLDRLADDVGEFRRQPGRRLIAVLLREAGITADVRDQERAYRCMPNGQGAASVRVSNPLLNAGSVLDSSRYGLKPLRN
jgi:hypothetical protein